MVEALKALGADIDEVDGSLHITPIDFSAQREAPPITIDCGLAGTVMRFVPPLAAATGREVIRDGDAQARVRPMSVIIDALTHLGVSITAEDNLLPMTIHAQSHLRGGHLEIDASASSQFVSGMLLTAPAMPLGIELVNRGETVPSRAHVDMTLEVLADAGGDVTEPQPEHWIVEPGLPRGLDVQVEPDLSNAAAFVAAALATEGDVTVLDWPAHTTQAGDGFRSIVEAFGGTATLDRHGLRVQGPKVLQAVDLDLSAIGELTPVVAALAAMAEGTSRLTGIGHLRGHETDRLSRTAPRAQCHRHSRRRAADVSDDHRRKSTLRVRGIRTTITEWSWPVPFWDSALTGWSSKTPTPWRRHCRNSPSCGKPC